MNKRVRNRGGERVFAVVIVSMFLSLFSNFCFSETPGVISKEPVSLKDELGEVLAIELEEAKHVTRYGEDQILAAFADSEIIKSAPVNPFYLIGPDDQIIINLWGDRVQTFSPIVDEKGLIEFQINENNIQFAVNGIYFKDLKEKVTRELAKVSRDIEGGKIFVDVTLGRIRGIHVFVIGEVKRPGQYTFNTTISSIFNVLNKAGGLTELGSMREILVRRSGGEKIDKVGLDQLDFYKALTEGKIEEGLFHLQDGDTVIVPPQKRVVTLSGEIKRPGAYELKENETLKDLIEIAGGFAPKADQEQIHIFRTKDEAKTKYLDIDFKVNEAFKLKDGDDVKVVSLPVTRRMDIVEIKGEGVRSPGIYQLKEGMTVNDLVELASGLYADAVTDSVVFVRTNEDFSLDFSTINLEDAEDFASSPTFALKSLDKLIVFSKFYEMGGEKYVTISGHVKEPGEYQLSYKMKLSDLIYMAGGFKDEDFLKEAYLERAELIRKEYGEQISMPFNLSKLLAKDETEDILLQSNDEVRIYSIKEIEGEKKVSISGHVEKPGTYRMWEKMSVSDLLFLGGGFNNPDFVKKTYLDRAEIVRIDKKTHRNTTIPFDLGKVLDGDKDENLQLQSLDKIVIYAFEDFQDPQSVDVEGEVRSPGKYEFTENMELSDVINVAKGLTEYADTKRIEVFRFPNDTSTNGATAEVFLVSLGQSEDALPFSLENNDRVVVRKKVQKRKPSIVKLEGEVAYPGSYVLLSRTERLTDLIERAGGLLEGAAPEAAQLIRTQSDPEPVLINLAAAFEAKKSSFDILLLDKDEIYVPKQNWIVKVRGEVRFPGTVQYIEGASVSHYIKYVGGYTENAKKGATLLILPNGEAKKARHHLLFSTKVTPGSTVLVPCKRETFLPPDPQTPTAMRQDASTETAYQSPEITTSNDLGLSTANTISEETKEAVPARLERRSY